MEIETTTCQSATEEQSMTSLSGKYITFKLANEEYAFQILKVREIIGMMEITRVPQSDDTVKGVINLRGKVNPVLDLRLVFGMTETVATEQTVIVMVQVPLEKHVCVMGILVDEVQEVLNVASADIEPPPSMGDFNSDTENFILGVAKVNQRVIFLLDIDKVLSCRNQSAQQVATN